ncbi:hypothetical protein EC836_1066 [Erwinia sp. JUb26]|nr:hypothetical protein EC836_1066 [Erwinia sp. JUb26]
MEFITHGDIRVVSTDNRIEIIAKKQVTINGIGS